MEDKTADDLEFGEGLLAIAGAIVPLAVGDPVVAAMGVLSTFGISVATKGILGRRMSRRLRALEDGIGEQSENIVDLISRIEAIEDCASLAILAFRSALESSVDEQAWASGRLLADGILGERTQEAEYAMRIMSRLTTLEIRAMQSLEAVGGSGPNEQTLPRVLGQVVSEDLVESVAGSLVGLGLLKVDPPGFSGWFLTPFGFRIAKTLSPLPAN